MDTSELKYLRSLRHTLHQYPELSGKEKETARMVLSELNRTNPDKLYKDVGGHGVVAVYGTDKSGPQIMFRSELDALKVRDEGEHEYRSVTDGVSHACGHDGHMAVMTGVARYLGDHRPPGGRVMILFQPSEETGEGAARMMNDPVFQEIIPDRSYAFHNLPGFRKGVLYLREDTFASASLGLSITLQGVSSHAAYPEQGKNPAGTVAQLINAILELGAGSEDNSDYSIATITYIQLGEKAFGISPGRAEIGVTLRAARDDKIDEMKTLMRDQLEQLSENHSIPYKIIENEPFKATVNNRTCIDIIKQAAGKAGLTVETLDDPFPWSEDFGRFHDVSGIALAGIGIGQSYPHLHAEKYDFNDEIIPAAVRLFVNIIQEEWKRATN